MTNIDFMKFRRLNGYSQAVLAKKLGCHQSFISAIECGNVKPSTTLINKFLALSFVDNYLSHINIDYKTR